MSYFSDLSPYIYSQDQNSGQILNIGWLDNMHPFTTGSVPAHIIEKLERLSPTPVNLFRGYHICELCPKPDIPQTKPNNSGLKFMTDEYLDWTKERRSNGEIRIGMSDTLFLCAGFDRTLYQGASILPSRRFS